MTSDPMSVAGPERRVRQDGATEDLRQYLKYAADDGGTDSMASRMLTTFDALQARLDAFERVVSAATDVEQVFDNDEFDTTNIVVETVLLRLFNALAATRTEEAP